MIFPERNSMEIQPLTSQTIPGAADLFARSYRQQRQATPSLPDALEAPAAVAEMLANTFNATSSLVAVEQGQVTGYLSWFLVDDFRGSGRKAAYVPEWGHACHETQKMHTYRALYRQAAQIWAAAGCQVHAITLLAYDHTAETTWFWNGFGLTVVDSVRPMLPLDFPYSTPVNIRMALEPDVPALVRLDHEHHQHYLRSPIFIPPRTVLNAQENMEFISRPKNSVWLAETGGELVGFMRFEGYDFDSVAVVEAEDGILITGAYVRPEQRGQKISVALLDAALRRYQSLGFRYCTVNFESFNPEAATFWMKYFDPVCLSVVRVPES
jgi:GNAT superfamily N-acetyltransferase